MNLKHTQLKLLKKFTKNKNHARPSQNLKTSQIQPAGCAFARVMDAALEPITPLNFLTQH